MKHEITWEEAPDEVINLAKAIIEKWHPEIHFFNIGFVFRSEGQKRGTKTRLAQVSKVPQKFHTFIDFNFIIWISQKFWDNAAEKQREAVIDHELCHITGNGSLVGHDIEEFHAVIARHGFWNENLKQIDSDHIVRQLELGEQGKEILGKIESIKLTDPAGKTLSELNFQ